jgi:hypothetical protein
VTKPHLIVVVCAIAVALAGCGSSGANANPGLGVLQGDVAAVRSAANAQDRAAAQNAVDKLVADVGRLQTEGQITSGRASTILSAVSQVDAGLGGLPIPTSTTTTTTTIATTTTVPSPPTTQPPRAKAGDGGGGGGKHGH